jgi:hypothetical protein
LQINWIESVHDSNRLDETLQSYYFRTTLVKKVLLTLREIWDEGFEYSVEYLSKADPKTSLKIQTWRENRPNVTLFVDLDGTVNISWTGYLGVEYSKDIEQFEQKLSEKYKIDLVVLETRDHSDLPNPDFRTEGPRRMAIPLPSQSRSESYPSIRKESSKKSVYKSRIDTQVLFSAYNPIAVEQNKVYTVIAYIFRESASQLVLADSKTRTAKIGTDIGMTTQFARQSIPTGSLVTAELTLPGFRINPARISIRFEDAWHHLDFEIRATDQALLDHHAIGQLTFMMDGVIVADLGLAIYVSSQSVQKQVATKSTEPYQAIFCSYSHKDTQIVERVEHVCQSLGMKYLRDITTLLSGEHWDTRLLQLIEQADIFQLFWSEFAAQSQAVEKEWKHALTLQNKGDAFIRPVYWKQPMTPPPPPLEPINFAYCPELAE